jgi:hypothetical protein
MYLTRYTLMKLLYHQDDENKLIFLSAFFSFIIVAI